MSKTLNDVAHELTLLSLEKNVDTIWTFQDAAENFKNTHEQLLSELKKVYETDDKNYLV
ncbi:hypothetical protein I6N96_01180 [Enterococcus sp. BWM-S5]|uniref:Uncharacterized protein n=1 Tax=Enterococcus larvae TaxID=2794352 RepID=A0ABS4CG97_9ENTE|nr:hypothetical protein [Enterococcus larvae]MBP1044874.1 hypothetical protein [Enterococcus larvae]